jgi:hypothetical protein
MKKEILELSTKKSIHPTIEIRVDGKTYHNNPLSHELFEQIENFDVVVEEGKLSALYKQVQLIFPVPMEILDKLDVRDIRSLLEYANERILDMAPKTEKGKAEKNASKPGAESSA